MIHCIEFEWLTTHEIISIQRKVNIPHWLAERLNLNNFQCVKEYAGKGKVIGIDPTYIFRQIKLFYIGSATS